MCHGNRIVRLVTDAALARFGVDLHDQIEVVVLRCPIAKLQHLGKFVGGINVQNGKRDLSKKRFPREPDEDVGILPHRPRHGDVFKGMIRFAKNENALVLKVIEMSALDRGHDSSGRGGSPEPPAARGMIFDERAIEVNRPQLNMIAGFTPGFSLRDGRRILTFSHARTSLDGVRFKDRGQRDFYALRCCSELGA